MPTSTERPRIQVHVRGADSGDALGLIELVSTPGGGPPLHRHPGFDEGFYVLEGELTFQLGDERLTAGAGEFVFVPRGAVHTYANLSDRDARLLLTCTPAGFERYFQRMAAKAAGVEPPPEALESWPEVEKLGPPLRPAETG